MRAGVHLAIHRWCSSVVIFLLLSTLCPARSLAGPAGKAIKKAAELLIPALAGAAIAHQIHTPAEPEAPADPVASAFEACIHDLTAVAVTEQRESAQAVALGYLQRSYRLAEGDAYDIVLSVLVDLCESHASTPLARLVPAFIRAVKNRAVDQWRGRKRYLRCEGVLSYYLQTCGQPVLQDEQVRLSGEADAARRLFCTLPGNAQYIILRHAVVGESFPAIGQELGLSADQARTLYHNSLRQVRTRLRAQCFSGQDLDE